MPTRIVLKAPASRGPASTAAAAGAAGGSPGSYYASQSYDGESPSAAVTAAAAAAAAGTARRRRNSSSDRQVAGAATVGAGRIGSGTATNNNNEVAAGSNTMRRRSSKRQFRSSILEALSVRSGAAEDGGGGGGDPSEYADRSDDDDANDDAIFVRLSTDDIRASPRLLGYLFAMIASAVMLVSVVQFYRETPVEVSRTTATFDSRQYFQTVRGVVLVWKLWGAVSIAAAGCLVNLLTILVHFDLFFFPKTWIRIFRDGSLAERNYIIGLIVFWIAGLHICTSSLSVGELQANVYFTTWIAFASTLGNVSVWRESAGLASTYDVIHRLKRETTYNWIWTAFFSLIFAGAVTDIWYNRAEVEQANAVDQAQTFDFTASDGKIILSIVWTEFSICLLAIALNEFFSGTYTFPCRCRRKSTFYRCIIGWRQVEGFVIFVTTVGKFYVILEYTGVDGVINGLSNAYYGVWGSFFNGVFAFGTWLNENKNITYLVPDGEDDGDEDEEEEEYSSR